MIFGFNLPKTKITKNNGYLKLQRTILQISSRIIMIYISEYIRKRPPNRTVKFAYFK